MENTGREKENLLIKIIINSITSIRLLGSLLLPFIYLRYGILISALNILFLFITDAIDGILARKFKSSTFLGSLLDATSDKLLNFMSFLLLSYEYKILIIPIILEVLILITNFSIYKKGGNVKTIKIGKIKTIIFGIFITLAYLLISLKILNILKFNISVLISVIGLIIISASSFTLYGYFKNLINAKNNKTEKIIKNKNFIGFKNFINILCSSNFYYLHKDESILKLIYK